jgi:hypothetical protein
VTTFPLTVYVHGKDGPQDLVLRNSGDVLLDLGLDRRRQPIGSEGQAYFPAIPPNFQGQEVPIGVESATFELSIHNKGIILMAAVSICRCRKKLAIFMVG